MDLVEALYERGETTVDRMFRMRHADGGWVWLRVRVELVDRDTGEPHLIGIAVDVTEQMRLVERSKTADIRLRDAIETISEAFVLWDAENRLVMCNSKYQQLHGIPDAVARAGTPYAEVIAAGRKPLVRSQVVADGRPEEGARSFEPQLEDGRWLQINERRTKDGGFVSVGTDITPIKRHEGKLIEGERRLMATIADLRQSRQKLEHAGAADGRARREICRGEGPRRGRQPQPSRSSSPISATSCARRSTRSSASPRSCSRACSARSARRNTANIASDIHQSGTYLLDVINDVLDMSRIEAGRMALDLEASGPRRARRGSRSRIVSTQAEAREITVVSDVGKNLRMRGDRRALKQMVLNLLSNAVKFTPAGGQITVRARTIGSAHDASRSRIPASAFRKDALSKLGRPFEQVQNQFTKSHSGSGLGLAITRRWPNCMAAPCASARARAKGTIVSVRLPVTWRSRRRQGWPETPSRRSVSIRARAPARFSAPPAPSR